MNKIKFSVNSWIFGNISFEELAKRAHEIGLDGLEIDGEIDKVDIETMKSVLDKYSLEAISICGTFSDPNRAFNHNDIEVRKKAIEYGKQMVDMAHELNTDKVLIVPSQVDKLTYYVSKEVDWRNSVEAIREIAEYAKAKGNIKIMIECVNKYEANLVYSLQDGINMAIEIGADNVGIIGDTFHMQLEESAGISSAIRSAGNDWLMHLHLGDNNREVPGKGSFNWRDILQSLHDINYDGAVSFEPLPERLTPSEIKEGFGDVEKLQKDMNKSLKMLKIILSGIKAN